jgi:hypothetical protein
MSSIIFKDLSPEEKANSDIKAAMDSVNLIYTLIGAGEHTPEIDVRVQANYRHLEIVLTRDHIINNSSADLSPLVDAIGAGKTFAPLTE